MPDPWMTLVFGVQALRRHVERLRCPLGGGLGVAADVYPHQVGTVHRILTDTSIRHLLADEVGLGKTVQALMVLNALRLQEPNLRTLILVPDNLRDQWWGELLSRGHVVALDQDEDAGAGRVHLVRASRPDVLKRLGSGDYDFLIIDEFHRLTVELQSRITEVSDEFSGVLVLTATPDLGNRRSFRSLMEILEPVRMALGEREAGAAAADNSADNDPVEFLRRRELEAAKRVHECEEAGWNGLLQVPPSDGVTPALAAQAFAMHRRFVRSRRADFRLVRRKHRPILVEPVAEEVQRQRLVWRYIGRLGELMREVQPGPLAQKALRSWPALRDRTGELRRDGHDPNGLLTEVEKTLSPDFGDTRLDALTDLLGGIWRTEVGAQVVVVAEDNPTIDYLDRVIQARFPRIGSLNGPRLRLRTSQLRSGQEIGNLGDLEAEFQKNLERFTSGETHLLLASKEAKQGLNMQNARHLVFYSLPWNPQEIDQWIGRLDRIGNPALKSETDGRLKRLEVYTIAQRGQVDSHIVRVMGAYQIFERPNSMDPEWLNESSAQIEQAALSPAAVDWEELERRVEAGSRAEGGHELDSPLASELPWNEKSARALFLRLRGTPPLEPCAGGNSAGHFADCEEALMKWLRGLHEHREYQITKRNDGYWTLQYVRQATPRGSYDTLSQVRLGDQFIDRDTHTAPFIYRRKDVGQPPRTHVTVPGRGQALYERPLYYLNHGSPLHEELVASWRELAYTHGTQGGRYVRLQLPENFEPMPRQPVDVALVVAWVDAAVHVLPTMNDDWILEPLPAHGKTRLEARARVAVELKSARMADERWIRSLLSARLLICAYAVNRDSPPKEWTRVQGLGRALLRLGLPECGAVQARSLILSDREEEQLQTCETVLPERLRHEAARMWEGKRGEVTRAVAHRRALCALEADEIERLYAFLRQDLARRLEALGAASAAIQRHSLNAEIDLHDHETLAMSRLAQERGRCLSEVTERMKAPTLALHNVVRVCLVPHAWSRTRFEPTAQP